MTAIRYIETPSFSLGGAGGNDCTRTNWVDGSGRFNVRRADRGIGRPRSVPDRCTHCALYSIAARAVRRDCDLYRVYMSCRYQVVAFLLTVSPAPRPARTPSLSRSGQPSLPTSDLPVPLLSGRAMAVMYLEWVAYHGDSSTMVFELHESYAQMLLDGTPSVRCLLLCTC